MNPVVTAKLYELHEAAESASIEESQAFAEWERARKKSRQADNMLRAGIAMARSMERSIPNA